MDRPFSLDEQAGRSHRDEPEQFESEPTSGDGPATMDGLSVALRCADGAHAFDNSDVCACGLLRMTAQGPALNVGLAMSTALGTPTIRIENHTYPDS